MKSVECIIWTNDGTWLQTLDNGVRRSSYCGKLCLSAAEQFCRDHQCELVRILPWGKSQRVVSKVPRRSNGALKLTR